jgi:AcrR family transcriptional regulator
MTSLSCGGDNMPSTTFFNLPKEKQDRIMEASILEISTNTYENLNLANIIRDSNIPRGSFYQYFKDKNDLYDYFMEYVGIKKYEFYGNLFDPSLDISFFERFEKIYLKGFEFAKEHPILVKAGKKLMTSSYYQKNETYQKSMNQVILFFKELIEVDMKNNKIRTDIDSKILATIILEMMYKVTFDEYKVDEIDFDHIEKIMKQMLDIIKKGIEVNV